MWQWINNYVNILNLTFDPSDPCWPEVDAWIQRPIALFLIQTSEGVSGQAALHEPVQVAVPFDQDANDAPLWSTVDTDYMEGVRLLLNVSSVVESKYFSRNLCKSVLKYEIWKKENPDFTEYLKQNNFSLKEDEIFLQHRQMFFTLKF